MYKNTSEAHTNIAGLVKLSKGTGIKLKVISQLKVKTGEDVFVTTIKATHQCNRKYLLITELLTPLWIKNPSLTH